MTLCQSILVGILEYWQNGTNDRKTYYSAVSSARLAMDFLRYCCCCRGCWPPHTRAHHTKQQKNPHNTNRCNAKVKKPNTCFFKYAFDPTTTQIPISSGISVDSPFKWFLTWYEMEMLVAGAGVVLAYNRRLHIIIFMNICFFVFHFCCSQHKNQPNNSEHRNNNEKGETGIFIFHSFFF